MSHYERATQRRIIGLFRDELRYLYLGDWTERPDNSNIEEGMLTEYLTRAGYSPAQIGSAIYKLRTEADNHHRSLYENNRQVYSLLRYGIPVKLEAGKVTETVHVVDWKRPEKNDFAIAEEVTLRGNHERRPDLVLYLNGIAVGVLELKRSSVTITEGIRQSISNQRAEYNEWFFAILCHPSTPFRVTPNPSTSLRVTSDCFGVGVSCQSERSRRLTMDKQVITVSPFDFAQGDFRLLWSRRILSV